MTSPAVLGRDPVRRLSRFALAPDPDHLVCTADQPVHYAAARCLEVQQALLRASRGLHGMLDQAGFARSAPMRRVDIEPDATALTDVFLLEVEGARFAGGLQLVVSLRGEVKAGLLLQAASDSPLLPPLERFLASQLLGRMDWMATVLQPGCYSRSKVLEQFEAQGVLESLRVESLQWGPALLDALTP